MKINNLVEWLSSFTPSGTPSTQASNVIYLVLGAAIGGLAASLPTIRRYLAKRLAKRAELFAADDNLRKLAAKKLNEHLKVFASFCNTAAAATIGAAIIVPYIGNHAPLGGEQLGWGVIGLGVMLIGQAGLRFMKSES